MCGNLHLSLGLKKGNNWEKTLDEASCKRNYTDHFCFLRVLKSCKFHCTYFSSPRRERPIIYSSFQQARVTHRRHRRRAPKTEQDWYDYHFCFPSSVRPVRSGGERACPIYFWWKLVLDGYRKASSIEVLCRLKMARIRHWPRLYHWSQSLRCSAGWPAPWILWI